MQGTPLAFAFAVALCGPAIAAPGLKGEVDALVQSAPKAKLTIVVVGKVDKNGKFIEKKDE